MMNMKVELKNIKICNAMSEETTAFTATIYVDGKRAGEARNDGRGGSTDYHFSDQVVRQRFETWAASLPPEVVDGITLPMNADFYLSNLVHEYAVKKEEAAFARRVAKFEANNKAAFLARGFKHCVRVEWSDESMSCIGLMDLSKMDESVKKVAAKGNRTAVSTKVL